MRVLIQRVKQAKVTVDENTVGEINKGILAFIGVENDDNIEIANKMLRKIINYRVFSDANNKMNLSLKDINGGLLLVSQFTLVANTNKGLRPSFSSAAHPKIGKEIYQHMVDLAQNTQLNVQSGIFAANMQISLINDGPVTFNLHG